MQLPAPEDCGDGFNYCGGDANKYPLDEIETILNNTLELKHSSTTMHRFFKPSQNQQGNTNIVANKRNSLEMSNIEINMKLYTILI